MNKNEALAKIEELKEFVEKCDKEEEIIYVPDNIMFENYLGDGDSLGLVFDNDRVLYTNCNKLSINSAHGSAEVTCKLVKVDKPRAGNWYFANGESEPDFSNKELYQKCIGDKTYYMVIQDEDVTKGRWSWGHYWQVVRVDE